MREKEGEWRVEWYGVKIKKTLGGTLGESRRRLHCTVGSSAIYVTRYAIQITG